MNWKKASFNIQIALNIISGLLLCFIYFGVNHLPYAFFNHFESVILFAFIAVVLSLIGFVIGCFGSTWQYRLGIFGSFFLQFGISFGLFCVTVMIMIGKS